MKQRSRGLELVTRARRALEKGDVAEGEKLARRALNDGANDPEVLHALAELAADAGNLDEATAFLQHALAQRGPTAPAAWQVKLGDLRVEQGKLDDGVRAYEAVLARAPEEKAAWVGLAKARDAQRNTHAAIKAWERVVALDQDDWEAAISLGEAWTEIREWARAEESFAVASKGEPDRPALLVGRGVLDMYRGRANDAIATLKACTARHPTYPPGYAALGAVLRAENRFEEAAQALQRAKELAPVDNNYTLALGRVLLEGGWPDRADAEAKAYLARHPGHSGALALESLASLARGDEPAVARFFDYAKVVSATRLSVPRGFADIGAFNKALAAHAASHPTLMAAPASHSTYDGLHSGSLLVEPRGPTAPFEEAIEMAVGAYWERLEGETHQPFVARRPHDVVLAMWCIVLGRGSHQGPHIHPAAWLSGVYYPQIPEGIRTGAGPEGWLEFGKPDREFPTKITPPLHRVRPEEGLVVIFPSYLYHRTIPFQEDGTRISVAFDVVPV
ncbi:MAG TPA: putative 2OG-Fe(II) oxygenase [Polyangia bacterium]